MENILEKTYSIAGDNNFYQLRTLIITTCFWIFANVLPSSINFFEEMPIVDLYSKSNNTLLESNARLNTTICNDHSLFYKVTYHKDFSIISNFHIECNNLLIFLIGCSVFAGGSVGSMIFQVFINYFGKLTSFIVALTILFLSLIGFFMNTHYFTIYILFFLIQMFTIILAYNSVVNLVETVRPSLRSSYITVVNIGYSISGFLFTIVFYFKFTWIFALVFIILNMIFFTICFILFTVKSPRQHVAYGNYLGFYNSVKYISKINSRWKYVKSSLPIPKEIVELVKTPTNEKDDFTEPLLENNKNNKSDLIEISNNTSNILLKHEKQRQSKDNLVNIYNTNPIEKLSSEEKRSFEEIVYNYFDVTHNDKIEGNEISEFIKLLQYQSQRNVFLIQCLSWFSITGIYYSSSYFLKYIEGNIFYNTFLLYLFDLFGYLLSWVFLNLLQVGRKNSILTFIFMSICSCIVINIRNNSQINNFLGPLLILRLFISGSYNLNFLYSLEVYPSLIRTTGFGINCNMGCFSAIVFPLFLLNDEFNSRIILTFIGFLLICFVLQLFITETKDIILYNIIPEESNLEYCQNYVFNKSNLSKSTRKRSYFQEIDEEY